MALDSSYQCISLPFESEGDLSAKQYYGVKGGTAAHQVVIATAGACRGIVQNDPSTGEAADVALLGPCKAIVDGNAGAIAFGDPLTTDAAGKLVKDTTDNKQICAIALEASTADGDIIAAFALPGLRY